MNRREFLATAALAPLVTLQWPRLALADARWDRTLLLIELSGGNDGLNTVVPYADPEYARLRPDIGVPRDRVLQLDERVGLVADLEPLMRIWADNQLAIAQGVGYPGPSLSHFRGIEIWDKATDSDKTEAMGWIGRLYAEAGAPPADFAADAITLGRRAGKLGPLEASGKRVVVLADGIDSMSRGSSVVPMSTGVAPMGTMMPANQALARLTSVQDNFHHAASEILHRRIDGVETGVEFPAGDLGESLRTAARLLIAGVRVPVIKAYLRGFDTHNGQGGRLPQLHAELAGSMAAFAQSMKAHGLWDDVLVMTYSEFGRRPYENASGGTDHGTAAPHFLIGGRVRGGLYGEQPSLERHDFPDGRNLGYRLHYRSLYATVAKEWWGTDASFLDQPPLGCIV
jgi:uncharacterized protein (DUF1501 family)